MKLKWEDISIVFEESSLWENGHDIYWYRLMWSLMDYRHLNEYEDDEGCQKLYSRVFSIIKIYIDFVGRCFRNDEDDFIEAVNNYSADLSECLYDDEDVKEIFAILRSELGTRRTFYSMYITCIEFGEEDDADEEYEEFEEYFDDADESDEALVIEETEDFSEDYYETFEEYINVLATSEMTTLSNITPEKAAGFIYLAGNMKE